MKFSDKILLIPIVLLFGNFLYRLINFSSILYRFPLDITNDLTAYIADIPFFEMYGYLGFVPQWYNGFILFNIYPPGWVFFTYPLYKLFGDLMLATFVSTLLLFAFGFLIIWFFGKELKLSLVKKVALFAFIYGNPMIIGAVFKQGRIPSLMALDLLVLFFFLCIYFMDRPLGIKAISLPLVYAGLILTHQTETVLASAFLLGLFLVKDKRERVALFFLMLLSIVFSSFWLFHFLQATFETGFLQFGDSQWLLDWHSYFWNNLAGVFLALGMFISFYLFYKQNKEGNWFLFFSPILLFTFLYLTRLVIFVPILKNVYPDPWEDFITLNFVVLFLSLQFTHISKNWKRFLTIALILVAVLSVGYNMFKTPMMEPWTEHGEEAIALIPFLDQDSHFLMFNEETDGTLYSRSLYSYAAIYYNVSSASGWFEVNKEYSYVHSLNLLYMDIYTNGNCEDLDRLTQEFNTTQLLANGKYCFIISKCGWDIIQEKGETCLLNSPLVVQQE